MCQDRTETFVKAAIFNLFLVKNKLKSLSCASTRKDSLPWFMKSKLINMIYNMSCRVRFCGRCQSDGVFAFFIKCQKIIPSNTVITRFMLSSKNAFHSHIRVSLSKWQKRSINRTRTLIIYITNHSIRVILWKHPLQWGKTVSLTAPKPHMLETDCASERICQSVLVMISSLKHASPSERPCFLLARVLMNNLSQALSGHSVTVAS